MSHDAKVHPGDVLHLNVLTEICGWFRREFIDSHPEKAKQESWSGGGAINNGYLCDHPDQESKKTAADGSKIGCCYGFSCPLAHELSWDDEKDRRLMRNAGAEGGEEEWMLLHRPVRSAVPEPPPPDESGIGSGGASGGER